MSVWFCAQTVIIAGSGMIKMLLSVNFVYVLDDNKISIREWLLLIH